MAIHRIAPIIASRATIVDLVHSRAANDPGRKAFVFVRDGEDPLRTLTYADLDREARKIAVWLQERRLSGERVMIAQPQGLEYITSLLGCFYAGSIAVPVYPPKLNRHLQRLALIVKDAAPRVALAGNSILAKIRAATVAAPELQQVQWRTLEEVRDSAPENWNSPRLTDERLALLQYTSGSTGDPRGVMVSHGNLTANQKMIQEAFGVNENSVIAGWLPLYHDMGLIGNVLQPLWSGAQCVLMSPTAFLQHPARWLKLITEYRATISGGPNFAYDLCCRKISADEQQDLDLSRWQSAFNGSEPVRAETMERFTRKFSSCGFSAGAWLPCYGLAEATLFVSGARKNAFPKAEAFGKDGQLPAAETLTSYKSNGGSAVSCGQGSLDQPIVIANPETSRGCQAHEVGEIWITGPSVARGYWKRAEATQATFQAFLEDNRGPFLRTGDLGFLNADRELFVTGRIKDLIIIRGRNLYPQDLEYTVQKSHPSFAGGMGAAFCIEVEGSTELAIVQEVASGKRNSNLSELIETAVKALAEEHEVRPIALGLVRAGVLPTTTSGKIRRQECKRLYLNGDLKLLPANRMEFRPADARQIGVELLTQAEDKASDEWFQVAQMLCGIVAGVLRISPGELESGKPLTALGMDSLQAAELKAKIAEKWGVELPWETILESATIAGLSSSIVACDPAARFAGTMQHAVGNEDIEFRLSFGQRALWFLYKLAPANAAYNIPAAFRIRGALDLGKLRAAFQLLVDRHDSLRTIFISGQNGPLQRILPHVNLELVVVPAETWAEEDLAERIKMEAARPFTLEESPLFRVTVFRRSQHENILLFLIHHIVTDLHSMTALFGELQSIYSSLEAGIEISLPRLQHKYSDFVAWQQKMLAGEQGERLRKYWQKQLIGELPVLKLPLDHPRPPVQTYSGAIYRLHIGHDVTESMLALARRNGVSLYTLLAAAFMALLHRYTSQSAIVIGAPVSGRTCAGWKDLTGYFINQVVLRASFSEGQRWLDLLEQVRQTVTHALANQDYPLALVADEMHPERNPGYPPLFQTMFNFYKAGSEQMEEMAGLAVYAAGHTFSLGSLEMGSWAVDHDVAPLDLTLSLAQIGGGLEGYIQYNTALFENPAIARMAGHFEVLLQTIVDDVDPPISELNLLSAGEKRQLLREWNDTNVPYDLGLRIHDMFAEQAEKSSASIAVVSAGEILTYSELEARANQLAHRLISLGAAPDTTIALCLERSARTIVSLLGILKSGAAYLPIDPAYPEERIEYLLKDARPKLVITRSPLAATLLKYGMKVLSLDSDAEIEKQEITPPQVAVQADHLAYVIYTSASTGKPKGVMISHRSVVNFMHGMDRVLDCGPEDTFLAVTSIAFDISVLELLWTITRGAKVIIAPELMPVSGDPLSNAASAKKLDYSLFYFASIDDQNANDKYRLLLEGAKCGDKNGLAAVWTPERHFHQFGGLYPNPAVTSAALAACTERIQLRAGSVVLPLHNVLRVAEEWSVVDNISGGRTGIAFASGWHADDFALAPENYAGRKEMTFGSIETFLKLWRGETVKVQSGSGKEIEVRIFPQPVQKRLPVWITAAGAAETFVRAGQIGANVLTHLLGQTLEELEGKIKLYRESFTRSGHSPAGQITLMLHTFIGGDMGQVKDAVRRPFIEYLRSSLDLIKNLIASAKLPVDLDRMNEKDINDLLAFAFDRYFDNGALFGTVSSCASMTDRLKQIGVDEVACLIDFGVEANKVLAGINGIIQLKEREKIPALFLQTPRKNLKQLIEEHKPTLLQCTPTMLRALVATHGYHALQSLRALMLGGESLPPALARTIKTELPCRLINMYGPTETTIWSSTDEIEGDGDSISVGRPIANTELYVLDPLYRRPVPIGAVGELHIGGDGLARGYFGRPDLTAERFVPNSFNSRPGARLYRTGDLARYLSNGRVDLLGRDDSQVKVRGVRMELGEIESALAEHPEVNQAAVLAREGADGDKYLVAYVVTAGNEPPAAGQLRSFLKSKLAESMVPSEYCFLDKLPVTANGKLNRQALPVFSKASDLSHPARVAPLNEYEVMIADIWKQVLALDTIGVDDNFFDLGGHSLRLVQVHGRLSRNLGKELPLMDLLEYPTIRSLARYFAEQEKANPTDHDREERAVKQRKSLLRRKDIFSNGAQSVQ